MNEQQYHAELDKLFLLIEHWLEKSTEEIDFEAQEGRLTLLLPQGQLIISRQTVTREIWLAAPQGAYHFHFHQNEWVSRQGQSLFSVIASCVQQQSGIILDISLIKNQES